MTFLPFALFRSGSVGVADSGPSLLRAMSLHPGATIGFGILGILLLCAIFAPLLSPYEPNAINVLMALKPPSLAHPFGTDELGRDILTRVMHGARISLLVVVVSVLGSMFLGVVLGLTAGYAGGWTDAVIMRLVDALIAIPSLILVLAIVAALGPDLSNAIIAIMLAKVAGFARIVRGEVLALKSMEYVKAARVTGVNAVRIAVLHIWPNMMGTVIVFAAITASSALMTESALSFLGLGVQPPTASWGYMVASGMQYWTLWWMTVFPGAAIFLCVMGFNLVADFLRDRLDIRMMEGSR